MRMAKKKLKMDPEAKKRWVAALRSGKYKQGTKQLCDFRGRFCCLGVYADIEIDGWWVDGWWVDCDSKGGWALMSNDDPKTGICNLDDIELPYAGDYPFIPAWAEVKLIEMNDDLGKSFDEIADWIEAEL